MIQNLDELAKTYVPKNLQNETPKIIGIVANLNREAVVACDDGFYGDYASRPSSDEQN